MAEDAPKVMDKLLTCSDHSFRTSDPRRMEAHLLTDHPGHLERTLAQVEAPLFHGHEGRECEEHRTVGYYRAWCYDCTEWCYPKSPCKGCELPALRSEVKRLNEPAPQPAPQPFVYPATLVRVVDGDTVRLRLDVGFYMVRYGEVYGLPYRLLRINAPELRTDAGKLSKKALEDFLQGKPLVGHTEKADNFGRWLIDLWAGSTNVSDWLVAQGFAEYHTYTGVMVDD